MNHFASISLLLFLLAGAVIIAAYVYGIGMTLVLALQAAF